MNRLSLRSIFTSGLSLSVLFLAQNSWAQTQQPLRVVSPKQFCQSVHNILTTLATQQGLDQRESMRAGNKAAGTLISQLKSGSVDPYMDASMLRTASSASDERLWFSTPEVLISAMGVAPKNVILVESINDLRLTSQVMPGSQILLLTSGRGDITAERARLVAKTAQALGVQMSMIWVGQGRDAKDARAAQGLAFMTALTGGVFLDLSGQNACSGT